MNSLLKLLQNSDTFSYLPESKKNEIIAQLTKIIENNSNSSLTQGFYQNYIESKLDITKDMVNLLLLIGKQSGIFKLKYQIENPITGSTIAILDENQLTSNKIFELQEELTDENGNQIYSRITSKDIYPFYYLKRSILNG